LRASKYIYIPPASRPPPSHHLLSTSPLEKWLGYSLPPNPIDFDMFFLAQWGGVSSNHFIKKPFFAGRRKFDPAYSSLMMMLPQVAHNFLKRWGGYDAGRRPVCSLGHRPRTGSGLRRRDSLRPGVLTGSLRLRNRSSFGHLFIFLNSSHQSIPRPLSLFIPSFIHASVVDWISPIRSKPLVRKEYVSRISVTLPSIHIL